MSILTGLLNTLVGTAVSGVLGNFFGRFGSENNNTLDTFLAALSTDFVNRVENVVRDAFTDQQFLQIKTDIRTAATAFRTYTASLEGDDSQLHAAYNAVLAARSRLFTSCETILAVTADQFFSIPELEQRGVAVVTHNRALESAMAALQAVVALDLLILAKKAESFPTIRTEIVTRIDECALLVDKLKDAYFDHQSCRTWVRWEHTTIKCVEDRSYLCTFRGHKYKDGAITGTETEGPLLVADSKLGEAKRTFENKVARKVGTDYTLHNAVTAKLASAGNIEEAVRTWTAVRAVFSN